MDKIRKIALRHKLSYRYYEKIINRVKPKIITEVVSYGFNRMIINEIAKEKQIPIVEFQHGVMGKYHVAYNFFSKTKYKILP